MSLGYQGDDRNIVDYKLWALPDVGALLRGPRRWTGSRPFLTFLGAAQTFGRFVQRPFPEIVGGVLDADYINFGAAGAGPEYYINRSTILNYVNRSTLCVVQVMSGRSVSTPLLESVQGGGMLKFLDGPRAGENAMAADAYRLVAREYGAEALRQQVADARERWVWCYRSLFDKISVPIAILWMSTRATDTSADPDKDGQLGEFPHLIGRKELEAIRRDGTTLIQAVVKQPTYMRLINPATGSPAAAYDRSGFPDHPEWARDVNNYYFVQHQHGETTAAIIRACIAETNVSLRAAVRAAGGSPTAKEDAWETVAAPVKQVTVIGFDEPAAASVPADVENPSLRDA
jgi:hypothetical protein